MAWSTSGVGRVTTGDKEERKRNALVTNSFSLKQTISRSPNIQNESKSKHTPLHPPFYTYSTQHLVNTTFRITNQRVHEQVISYNLTYSTTIHFLTKIPTKLLPTTRHKINSKNFNSLKPKLPNLNLPTMMTLKWCRKLNHIIITLRFYFSR